MGKKPISRMAVSERAKQFMPFKAVAGLDEALERKRLELGIVERRELSEEELLELDKKFSEIKKDDANEVVRIVRKLYEPFLFRRK